MEYGHFDLVLHEILGNVLMCRLNLRDKLLKAYAAQKYSMLKKVPYLNFYIAQSINNVTLTTNRNLINYVNISFNAGLIKLSESESKTFSVFDDKNQYTTEKECRRYIDANHPLIVNKLGCSANDFSNMTFITREIEILFNDYRLVINPVSEDYSIQYKKKLNKKTIFRCDTLTLEVLYSSIEGQTHINSNFIITNHNKSEQVNTNDIFAQGAYVMGLASFLDCKNIAVKTIYFKSNDTVLYQRILPDNYTKSHPFVLENEYPLDYKFTHPIIPLDINPEGKPVDLIEFGFLFYWASWKLNARLPNLQNNGIIASSSKPIHTVDSIEKFDHRFLKFDGIPATLKFYAHHFVIMNSISSNSFQHSLTKPIVHSLRDFYFLVESNLYESEISNSKLEKPLPLVIIDLHTTAFNATRRMNIIQVLRQKFAKYLYDYFIFFQGEIQITDKKNNDDNNVNNNNNISKQNLIHNEIYETRLSSENKVEYIIKRRKDKLQPNSRKLVNVINQLNNNNNDNNICY